MPPTCESCPLVQIIGQLCEMVGFEVPVVVVPHCKPQLASHPAFGASLGTLRGMGTQVH
jgi:hypothetical protein